MIDLTSHIMRTHFLRCKQCPGLRFATMKELSEHTAAKHMPVAVISTATQTEPTKDSVIAKNLGVNQYSSESSDESFQSADSQPESEIQQVYTLPIYETRAAQTCTLTTYETEATQTTAYQCHECIGVFDMEADLEFHMEHSPFHGPRDLMCTECHIGPFQNQIELLKHIESKPHKTQWVLSMV